MASYLPCARVCIYKYTIFVYQEGGGSERGINCCRSMLQEKLIIDAGECAYEALSYAYVLTFCDKQDTQTWARHHIQSECAD